MFLSSACGGPLDCNKSRTVTVVSEPRRLRSSTPGTSSGGCHVRLRGVDIKSTRAKGTLCLKQSLTRVKNAKFKLCTCRGVRRVTHGVKSHLLQVKQLQRSCKNCNHLQLRSPRSCSVTKEQRNAASRSCDTRSSRARKAAKRCFISAAELATLVASAAKQPKLAADQTKQRSSGAEKSAAQSLRSLFSTQSPV